MGEYYFLAAALPELPPELRFGRKPELSFLDLQTFLEPTLRPADHHKMAALRRYFDITNVRALLLDLPFDHRGNLSNKELDEALLVRDFLPEYLFGFWEAHPSRAERIERFAELLSAFFIEEAAHTTGFLHRYFLFERELHLISLALRCAAFGRDTAQELLFEDQTDLLVRSILAQRDTKDYHPPVEYEEVRELFLLHKGDPWLLNQAYAEYRFKKIPELLLGDQLRASTFSMDSILAYAVQLILVEQWWALSHNNVSPMVEQLIGT